MTLYYLHLYIDSLLKTENWLIPIQILN